MAATARSGGVEILWDGEAGQHHRAAFTIRDGRPLVKCRIGDLDVGAALVRSGWALAEVRAATSLPAHPLDSKGGDFSTAIAEATTTLEAAHTQRRDFEEE